MAIHKSALKRARQNIKRNLRNRSLLSHYRTEIKKFVTLIEGKSIEECQKKLPLIHKTIDKMETKGVISKNAASRKKSRLTIQLNKMVATSS